MAKLSIISMLFPFLIVALPMAYSRSSKVTKLRYFVHDRWAGSEQSFYRVAQSDMISSTSPTYFGHVYVVDDPITLGPSSESRAVGRAQGMFSFADFNQMAPHMSVTFVFTSTRYERSTISILGRNDVAQKNRQLSIVGGTGAFEMARGVVTVNNYSVDSVASHLVLQYDLVIHH